MLNSTENLVEEYASVCVSAQNAAYMQIGLCFQHCYFAPALVAFVRPKFGIYERIVRPIR
jgi:hypothetical protein